jgi:hypothetical protein
MPLFNIYAIPIMDTAFETVFREIDKNPSLSSAPTVNAARSAAEVARENVHRAADAVRNTNGFLKSFWARHELRQAGYAAKLALETLVVTADDTPVRPEHSILAE